MALVVMFPVVMFPVAMLSAVVVVPVYAPGVTAQLRPMTDDELSAWLENLRHTYVADRIATGEAPEEAKRIADLQTEAAFPAGTPAAGNLLSRVCVDGEDVGWLWIGPRNPAFPESFWVWDVLIDERFRGRGYGRAAMELAEAQALAAGATEIGLNVFGPNTVARGLYESLGYEITSLQMRKALSP
jgi:ribosomal protein S18 acetylase RimI-like enzyme